MRLPIDTECYPNFWLFGCTLPDGTMHQIRMSGPDARLTLDQISFIRMVMETMPTMSFNGLGYDLAMINAAININASCQQLKAINDQLIEHRVAPWKLGLPRWAPGDHIDIMEVIPGAGGQKYKAGLIHIKRMQDLPYEPSRWLTEPEMDLVAEYNAETDLVQLQTLYDYVRPQIALREKLTDRYGIDLRSKSDAQLAEAVLKMRCEQALGREIKKPSPDRDITFKYDPPIFLNYHSSELQETLAIAQSVTFGLSEKGAVVLPPELEGRTIQLGFGRYRMGIGGLHSSEESTAHVAGSEWILEDIDVDSYYPAMIENAGAWPAALGQQFLVEFGAIKDERLLAKRTAKAVKSKLKELYKELANHDDS